MKQAPEQTDIINSIERKQETVKKDEKTFLRFKHTRTYTHTCWLNRELFVHCLAASAYFNFYTLHNPAVFIFGFSRNDSSDKAAAYLTSQYAHIFEIYVERRRKTKLIMYL